MVEAVNFNKGFLSKDEIKKQAEQEIKKERQEKAVAALKKLYAQKADAEKIVRNIDRQIEDYLEEQES